MNRVTVSVSHISIPWIDNVTWIGPLQIPKSNELKRSRPVVMSKLNKIVEYKCDVIHKVQDQLIKYCSASLFLAIFMNNLPNQRVLFLPGLVWNPIEDQVVPLCRTDFRVRLKQPLFGLRSGNAFWIFLHHTLFASKSYIFSSTCSRLVVTYRISDISWKKIELFQAQAFMLTKQNQIKLQQFCQRFYLF